jgi:hypothetical protein
MASLINRDRLIGQQYIINIDYTAQKPEKKQKQKHKQQHTQQYKQQHILQTKQNPSLRARYEKTRAYYQALGRAF